MARVILGRPAPPRVLVVDHRDSFTFNLVDLLAQLGAEVRVLEADELRASEQEARTVPSVGGGVPNGILLSPGPGRPEDTFATCELALRAAGQIPVLGVCLGHQVLAQAFGGKVARITPVHGKASKIWHGGVGLFRGLPSPLSVARYHSLAVTDVPPGFEVTAKTDDDVIMAMEDPARRASGIQFHPESFISEGGRALLDNWIASLA